MNYFSNFIFLLPNYQLKLNKFLEGIGINIIVLAIILIILALGMLIFRALMNRQLHCDRSPSALYQNEEQFRIIFAESPIGIALVSAQTYKFIQVNKSFCEMLGYSEPELMMLSFLEITHPEDIEKDLRVIQKSENKELPSYQTEKRFIKKNQEVIWTNVTSTGIHDLQGQLLYGLGMVENVTERKQAEEELQEYRDRLEQSVQIRTAELVTSNEQLKLEIQERQKAEAALRESQQQLAIIAANLPGVVYRYVLHPDGKISIPYISEGLQELTDIPAPEMMAHPERVFESVEPEDRIRLEEALRVSAQTLAPLNCEYRLHAVSGEIKWVRAIAKLHALDNRDIVFDGLALDITPYRYAEEALRESEATNRALISGIPDALYRIHRDGTYVDYVPSLEVEPYLSPSEFLGKKVQDVMPEPVASQLHRAKEQALATGETQMLEFQLPVQNQLVDYDVRILAITKNEVLAIVRDISSRKQAEAALQESQHFIQKIADTTPVILYVYDLLESRDVYINRQVTEILGYTLEQFQAMKSSLNENILHPEDLEKLVATHNRWQTAKEGEIIHTEFRMRHADGSWRILEGHETLFARTPEGQPKQILGAAVDITERRQAEEERDRFFNLSVDLLGIADCDGYFKRVNPAVTTILGYSIAEFVSTPFLDFVHPDDRELTIAEYQKIIAGERTLYFENRYRCQDGSYKWLSWTAVPVPTTGLIYTVARDTTERRQAEEALRESREKYRVLFEILPIGIAITDEVGNIIDVNSASEKILQLAKEELTRRNCGGEEWQVVNAEGTPIPAEEYASVKALTENRLIENIEVGIVQSDRQITWLNVTAAPIPLKGYGVTVAYIDITERRLAQEALYRREKEFRTLAENTPDIITRFDRELRHVYVNPAAEIVSGLLSQTFIGKTNRELGLPEPQLSSWEETMRQVFATGCETLMEFDYPTADGDKYFQARIVPELAADGTVEFILCTTRDITELKKMEASLRMAQARLKYLLSASPAIIYSCKPSEEQCCTFISENITGILGYLPQDVLGNPRFWWNCIHPEDIAQVLVYLPQLYQTGHLRGEYRFQHQDGSYRWMYDEARLVRDANGNPLEIVGCWVDITQRKQAQEQLIRVSQAVESASDGIAIADVTEQHIYCNRALQDLFEYSTEVLTAAGGPPILFVDPTLACGVFDTIRQGGTWSGEVQMQTRTGKILEILLRANAIKDNTGKMLGLVAVHTDISNRKRIQEELAQRAAELARSNAELEQFAYVASHDLQEPLRMVASYTQLLARRYTGQLDAKADRFIAHAVEGALRMQQLIEDLLKYSRVGTQGQEFIPVDSQVVFATAISHLQLAIRESGAVVTGKHLPVITGDEIQLVQLFQNLIGNAIKYRGERSPIIRVQAQRQPRNWLFSVSDNGIGIAPQHTERIFQIFQRLHLREEYPGTGIGLALCKKIVERHGGQIWVESQLGQGATFYFTIPDSGGILL